MNKLIFFTQIYQSYKRVQSDDRVFRVPAHGNSRKGEREDLYDIPKIKSRKELNFYAIFVHNNDL